MIIATMKNKLIGVIEDLFPSSEAAQRALSMLRVLLASCFIGICAQIKIPLYFTPVPLTLQSCAVMLVGALLGSRKGALAVLFYLFQGSIGLPVWAGGAAGFLRLLGPVGGYYLTFVAQAYLVGWLIERQKNSSLPKTVGACLLSTVLELGMGSLWLAYFVGIQNCFMLGFYPFIIGETIKSCFVAAFVNSRRAATT